MPDDVNMKEMWVKSWRGRVENFINHVFDYSMNMVNIVEAYDHVVMGKGDKTGQLPIMLTNLMMLAGEISTEIQKQKGATNA